MLDERIARRYAKALFDLALEVDCPREIGMEFLSVTETLDENASLGKLFVEGVYVTRELEAVTRGVFKDKDAYLVNFICLLIEKRRTAYIYLIQEVYQDLLDQYEGIADAEVVSAFALDEADLEKIKRHLEEKFQIKIRLNAKVDPSLIAGIRVQYKDYVSDSSYKTRLLEMSKKILANEQEVNL